MAKILIVDDAVFMRKLLRDILTAHGHEIVDEGINAKEAVEKFELLKPDLMTLDVVMPKQDGVETSQAIQQIVSKNPSARILMVSSKGQQSVITEMLMAGASDFVVKPFNAVRIIKAVNRLLRR